MVLPVPLLCLPAGINFLHVRSRYANGKWSQLASQLFFKVLPANTNGDAAITRVEYFFNSDPGFGAGVSVPIIDIADVSNLAFTPDQDTLQEDINRLYVRSMDANGKWSQLATQGLFVCFNWLLSFYQPSSACAQYEPV